MNKHHADLFLRALPHIIDGDLAAEIREALRVYDSWDGILVDRERDIANVGDVFKVYGSETECIIMDFDSDIVRYCLHGGSWEGSSPRDWFETVAKLEAKP